MTFCKKWAIEENSQKDENAGEKKRRKRKRRARRRGKGGGEEHWITLEVKFESDVNGVTEERAVCGYVDAPFKRF